MIGEQLRALPEGSQTCKLSAAPKRHRRPLSQALTPCARLAGARIFLPCVSVIPSGLAPAPHSWPHPAVQPA